MMDISKADDIRIGSVPVQSAWLGGRKVWDRTERKIMRSMVCWYDIARQGCTNEGMAQNPVLKDLSGNGHDMECYNFAWAGMSGIGGYGYKIPLPEEGRFDYDIISENVFVFHSATASGTYLFNIASVNADTKGKIRITNMPDGLVLYYNINNGVNNGGEITQDGVYDIPFHLIDADHNHIVIAGNKFRQGYDMNGMTIEFLPDYPGALVSDGVDDYAQVAGLPLFTRERGYTVIAKHSMPMSVSPTKNSKTYYEKALNYRGSFGMYGNYDNSKCEVWSFGEVTRNLATHLSDINVITSTTFNGVELAKGAYTDIDIIRIFARKTGRLVDYSDYALYSFLLFNCDLTDSEIEWVKANLINGYPTPNVYYDCSLYTNETIDSANPVLKDLSGHGHDLALKNFAFAGMSGFGGYNVTPKSSAQFTNEDGGEVTYNTQHTKAIVTNTGTGPNNFWQVLAEVGSVSPSYSIRVTGLTGSNLIITTIGLPENFQISKDGEYFIPEFTAERDIFSGLRFSKNYNNTPCNITIELIPLYPNALIFDGVDDYGVGTRDSFDKCTMFMLFKPIAEADGRQITFDGRNSNEYKFAIYRYGSTIAYNERNENGTYINNVMNNSLLASDLVGKKHLVIVKGNINNAGTFRIGVGSDSNNYDNMALYKFLLFDRELTQEQIDKVIQDYHLMDDVDDVWNQ